MPKKKKSLQSTTQPHPLPSTISSPSQDPSPDQPSPQTPQQQSRPHRRRTRSAPRVIASIWYHTSFSFFIVLLAVVFVASAWGLAEQALRTGGVQRWWNIIIIVGAYVVLAFISLAHIWSRLLSIKKILRTMPKPYIPTKQMDVPKKVADHIMTEYSRTAVIAHISQATKGSQEGWGRPGTKWENQHFRTYILSTISTMRQALAPDSTAPPYSLHPLFDAADQVDDQGATRLFVNSYARLVEQARYGKREPGEIDAAACEKVVDVVVVTMELKRRREREIEKGEG